MSDWKCAHKGCTQTVKRNKFATIKAHDKGWFFTKEGRAYCPEHLPSWVKSWRARGDTERPGG